MKIVIYEIEKDYFGENKDNETYCGEFSTANEVANWLYDRESIKTSKQNINMAIKKHYLVLDKYLVFRYDLEESDNYSDLRML